MDKPKVLKVFCSHRSVDKPRVRPIAEKLLSVGIKVFYDEWDILPGDEVVGRINQGLAECDVVLFFLSRNTFDGAPWIGAEAGAVQHLQIEGEKRLIPVRIDADAPAPPLLRRLAYVDAEPFDRLVRAIKGESDKPELGSPTATERTFRVKLASRGEREIEVSATLDGQHAAGPVVTSLSPEVSLAYRDRLPEYLPSSQRILIDAANAAVQAAFLHLGKTVGATAFPGMIGSLLAALPAEGTAVAVEIESAEPTTLLSIPYEEARLPDGTAPALDPAVRMLRRYTEAKIEAAISEPSGYLSILVAVGAPDEGKTTSSVLDSEAELGALLDAVAKAQASGRAGVQILEIGHPQHIRQALAERHFQVLHLSGQGAPGMIELETEDGEPCPTSGRELLEAINQSGRTVPLVFLSCSHSGASTPELPSLAQSLLDGGIPQVLAMQSRLTDQYAARFASLFYEGLVQLEVPLASRALALARQRVAQERSERQAQGELLAEFPMPFLCVAGEEAPLFDSAAPCGEDLRLPHPVFAKGSLPRLKVAQFIGRRRELRMVLRLLRDDSRAVAMWGRRAGVMLLGMGGVGKSALAGKAIERLAAEGWWVVVVEGRFSLGDLAQKAGVELADAPDELGEPAAALRRPNLADAERLDHLRRLLAERPVLLVLDNFESQLSRDGQTFLDPSLGGILAELAGAARCGKLLVTSRYPVPGVETWLAPLYLGPLSTAETRKLLARLPRLARQDPVDIQRIVRWIGGHPRMLEYLDALMNEGVGRLPAVTEKLAQCAAQCETQAYELGGSLEEAFRDVFWLGAHDVFLDELLAAVERHAGDREVLDQLAVFPVPIRRADLARALKSGKGQEDGEELSDSLKRLEGLSLVTPLESELAWVHRWTAEALASRLEPHMLLESCRRAGEALAWRGSHETHSLEDAKEAARLLLRAEAWDRAAEEGWGVLDFLHRYGQALDLVAFAEEIVVQLPEGHDDFPRILGISANGLWTLGAAEPARERTLRASQIFEKRAVAEPHRADHQRDLAISYHKMGDLLTSVGEGESARRFYIQDLEITRQLAAAEPQRADYQRDLSVSYNKMGDLLRALGDGEQARNFYQNALDLSRQLAAAEPQRADYQRDLSVSYNKMGDLLRALGDGEQARNFYQDALDLSRRLAAAEPQRADYQRDLSVSFERMGDLLVALGDGEEARNFYQDALDLSRRLAASEPQRADYQRDLSVSYNKMGDLLWALDEGEEARSFYQDALDLSRRLAAAEPQRADYQRDLSVSYNKMGDLLWALDEGEEARSFYRDALDLSRRLAATEPQRADYQRDLSVSFERMGDLLVALGEGEQARSFYQQELEIARRLAASEPQRADYQRDLAITLHRMITVDPENAGEYARDALGLLKNLRRRRALLPPDEPWLRALEEFLAGGQEDEA